jgi:hypothetical protein
VPRRTPKYAFARTTIESRIQTKLENSSKTIFYAIRPRVPGTQEKNGPITGDYFFLVLAAGAGQRSRLLSIVLGGIVKVRQGRLSHERA